MRAAHFIARRLRLGSGRKNRPSTSVCMAVCGVALSVVVMMLSIAVVSGFKQQIRGKVSGFESQVNILATHIDDDTTSVTGIDYLTLGNELKSIIDDTEMFAGYDLTVRQPAILKTHDDFEGIVLYGVSDESAGREFVTQNLEIAADGNWLDESKIAVSRHTADALGLDLGSKVYAYFFIDGTVRARRLEVGAIYNTNFGDYDKMFAFVPIKFLQDLNGLDAQQGTQIDLTCDNGIDVDAAAYELQRRMMMSSYSGELPGVYRITDINQTATLYLNWLELLDMNVVVILVLMILVSGFTLISSLFIIILERVSTIGLLKALGASNRQIREVFIAIGWRLVAYGMIIGNVVSLGLIAIQFFWHVLPLDPDAYYLSFVPVRIGWGDVILLNAGVFIISWTMLLIPVRMISRISPAQSLRYE